eukprot:CAMPEP_0202810846 /NCGR_PEP_ID=MMETSP1389-20130828/2866_1 /ASSEMBLY_ACC=CAM_ASM_000865 /TAXON_ID=302021 /ORGANISM="Rhodomonas sp., Strain CCMP768" /LENGTH=63 /DNA_ID=CAMNT_0049481843 /DNA_START=78 /DNA_END=265 /DNA_ORIENTATION=-
MAEKTGKGFAPTAAQSLRKGYNNLLGSFVSKPGEMEKAESQADLVFPIVLTFFGFYVRKIYLR